MHPFAQQQMQGQGLQGLQGLSSLANQRQPSPKEKAATDWHLAVDRLDRARAAALKAQEELAAAEHSEREAWGALEVIAGRSAPKSLADVKAVSHG